MNKENILFGIIGLLLGLIVGFVATNYINRTGYTQVAQIATSQTTAAPTSAPNAPFASQALPQVNNQVVRDQPQTGGMMPQVQQVVDRAKNEPNNFDAQMAAGDLYYRIQRFEEAGQFFEKASKLNPASYEAMVKTGNAYFDANQFEHAEEHYLQALEKNPNDVNVRTDLGLSFFLRQPKNVERAIAEYQKSLQVNPDHELTLQNLAAALREKGDAAAMQETLARLGKVNPSNPVIAKFKQQ